MLSGFLTQVHSPIQTQRVEGDVLEDLEAVSFRRPQKPKLDETHKVHSKAEADSVSWTSVDKSSCPR